MRATSTVKKTATLLLILRASPSLCLPFTSYSHQPNNNDEIKKRQDKTSKYILGPNLPDIWSYSPPNPAPSQLIPVDDGSGPTIIDGKAVAKEIRSGISKEIQLMKETINKVPGLAVILVGQRKDSRAFVRYKIKACEEVGIKYQIIELPDDCTEDDVLDTISKFNKDPSIHGILVQLPLPQHMNETRILKAISLDKDVDGFHPINLGNLALRGREPLVIPCAARACIELLLRSSIELKGKHVAVIGQNKIAGLPTSLLLQRHLATVSNIHAFTKNPENITRQADIVISSAGVANLVRGSWLKRGAIVIDVGTNPVLIKNPKHAAKNILCD